MQGTIDTVMGCCNSMKKVDNHVRHNMDNFKLTTILFQRTSLHATHPVATHHSPKPNKKVIDHSPYIGLGNDS